MGPSSKDVFDHIVTHVYGFIPEGTYTFHL